MRAIHRATTPKYEKKCVSLTSLYRHGISFEGCLRRIWTIELTVISIVLKYQWYYSDPDIHRFSQYYGISYNEQN
jgi:hypothetical protein